MVGRLQAEIRQKKPFGSLEEGVFVNLQRTADALMRGLTARLRPSRLSPPQYNVLRILRGARPEGLPCGEIAERMVTRDPDITRLLDRLEARGLVRRSRGGQDRRVVTAGITDEGLKLLRALDKTILEFHRDLLGHIEEQRLRQLDDLLDRARDKARP